MAELVEDPRGARARGRLQGDGEALGARGQGQRGGHPRQPAARLALKKKCHEETVFRNQALSKEAGAKPKRFVNDTIRGDFHRKFMHRFVKSLK